MKIKELIEKLQTFDPEMEIMSRGYEGGYENIERIESRQIAMNVNGPNNANSGCEGPHKDYDAYWHDENPVVITAIVINGFNLYKHEGD